MKKYLSYIKKFTKSVDSYWILTFLLVILKSNLFLAMFRTPNSSSIDIFSMYFGVPVISTHLSFAVIFVSIALLFKGRARLYSATGLNLLLSIMLVLNLWYYRAYKGFYSIRHIIHPELFNPLNRSIVNFHIIDILYFLDILLLIIYIYRHKDIYKDVKRNVVCFLAFVIVGCGVIYNDHQRVDKLNKGRPGQMVFVNSWAPFQTMSNLTPIGFWSYDTYRTLKECSDYKLSSGEEEKINNWLNWKMENIKDNNYFGMFKGKNIIALQIESLENFVINAKVNDEEITPNMNKLLKNSLYFNNIHEQNGGGTSSDADFMFNTGMFPISSGSVVFRYPSRNLETLPKLLQEKGYKTYSAKAENAGNWNWVEMHKGTYKFQEVWDISNFKADDLIGTSISDASGFRQIGEKVKDIKEPFYINYATLSSHGPFEIPENKKLLKLPETLDKSILGAYFQSIRYVDEQIGSFIDKLNNQGILDNTVVVIYGDHGGVHKFYGDELKAVDFSGDWWKHNDEKIPYIVFNSKLSGNKIDTIGGTADLFSTTAYLMGIEEEKFINKTYGRNLLKTNRNFTVMNNGRLIGDINEKDKLYLENSRDVSNLIITSDYFNKNSH